MKCTNRGFSLIDAIVSMAVMATGLLAVATFQTTMLSNSNTNKARNEALALTKEKIEGFRNYTSTVITDRAKFDIEYHASSGNISESITGNNASFTSKHSIVGDDNEIKNIAVVTEWTDRRGKVQSVTLNTNIEWLSPRAAADTIIENKRPLIPTAGGRARLGHGTYTGSNDVDNGDGTSTLEAGNELKLIVGNDIVLTLEDACQSAGNCKDFVKISGRVFISTNRAPSEVYVKASDTAYCHRYYTIGGKTSDVDSTTTAAQTPNTSGSNYEYFDYTCYLGGGWYGNIGIVFSGGASQTDKICVGDPTITNPLLHNFPVIASRRAYRGMLYKIDDSTQSGKEEIAGLIRYYSIGIADETILPATGKPGHNFVIANMDTPDTNGDKCILNGSSNEPKMSDDSIVHSTRGQLFVNIQTDFVCLDSSNIDTYSTSAYGVEISCPYNPSEPPSSRHTIGGTANIDGDSTTNSDVTLLTVNTSNESGN